MTTASTTRSSVAVSSALSAIETAESQLRQAAATAASSGFYDEVVLITEWARAIQAIGASARISTSEVTREPLVGAVAQPLDAETRKTAYVAADVSKPMKATAGKPVFRRDSDFLVKTAWSRKSRSEYEHRAPVEVVTILAAILAEWRPSKKLLTAEHLLEAYAKRKGTVISYQVYVALGWMMQTGLVRRHGRGGYSVPSPPTIVESVQKAWAKLMAD
jgi:hypothetical protein